MKDIYGKLREEHVQLLRTVSNIYFCFLLCVISCVVFPYRQLALWTR